METSANLAAGGNTGIGGFLTFADRAVRSHLSEMLDSGQLSTIGCRLQARYFQSQIAES